MKEMKEMIEFRILQVEQDKPKTFDEFYAIVCKTMPDVSRYPEMYNLCYNLMKLSWDTSHQNKIDNTVIP